MIWLILIILLLSMVLNVVQVFNALLVHTNYEPHPFAGPPPPRPADGPPLKQPIGFQPDQHPQPNHPQ